MAFDCSLCPQILKKEGVPVKEGRCTSYPPKVSTSVLVCCSNNCQKVLSKQSVKTGRVTMSDGAKIDYEVAGKGTPLLLIHGGDTIVRRTPYSTSDFKASASWESQFQEFAKEFKVIRFDIRGFGKSTLVGQHPIDSWAWKRREDRTVTDVVELLKFLNIPTTHVVGLSIGSGIAAQLAAYHPKRVNKLIIASPWLGHSLSFSSAHLRNLNPLKKRTLLIVGAKDASAIREANAAKRRGYNPKREVIPSASHFSNREQPTKFNHLVLTFLRTKPTINKLYKQEHSTTYGWGKRPEQFGLQEGEEIETFGPHTFSLDSRGNLYVVDTINAKIKVLNDKGRYQRNIDFTGWASDIITGRNNELFILDNDSLAIQPVRGNLIRSQLSPKIPQVEGYGQGMRFDNAGNLYLCQFQQCYQVGVAQKRNVTKILPPDKQMENIKPGYPIKGNNWIRTVWKNNHEAVIEIMDEDWALVQTIPMKTKDVFGMVGFLREDDKGFLYFEVERITRNNYVHLEIWQYDKTGRHISITELPNDYYSTVYKKVFIDSKGKMSQVVTTPNGVKSVTWKAAYIQIKGKVKNNRNNSLAGIKIKVPLVTGAKEVFSGLNGDYDLRIYENKLPSSFAMIASGKDFLPVSKNITKSNKQNDYVINFTMRNIPSNMVLLEIEPTIHHLGDGHFSGAANSQFQQRTEGSTYTKAFKINNAHLKFPKAEIAFFVKGAQNYHNIVNINGTQIGYLDSSPSNGSFGNITFNFDAHLLKKGQNTLEVKSAHEGSDYDDFEFTNIFIRFKE